MTSGYTHRPSDSYLYHSTYSSVLQSLDAATASGGPSVLRLLWLRVIAGTTGRRNWGSERPISSSTSEWPGRNFERIRKGGEVVSVGIILGVKLLFLHTPTKRFASQLESGTWFFSVIEMDRLGFAWDFNLSFKFSNLFSGPNQLREEFAPKISIDGTGKTVVHFFKNGKNFIHVKVKWFFPNLQVCKAFEFSLFLFEPSIWAMMMNKQREHRRGRRIYVLETFPNQGLSLPPTETKWSS